MTVVAAVHVDVPAVAVAVANRSPCDATQEGQAKLIREQIRFPAAIGQELERVN